MFCWQRSSRWELCMILVLLCRLFAAEAASVGVETQACGHNSWHRPHVAGCAGGAALEARCAAARTLSSKQLLQRFQTAEHALPVLAGTLRLLASRSQDVAAFFMGGGEFEIWSILQGLHELEEPKAPPVLQAFDGASEGAAAEDARKLAETLGIDYEPVQLSGFDVELGGDVDLVLVDLRKVSAASQSEGVVPRLRQALRKLPSRIRRHLAVLHNRKQHPSLESLESVLGEFLSMHRTWRLSRRYSAEDDASTELIVLSRSVVSQDPPQCNLTYLDAKDRAVDFRRTWKPNLQAVAQEGTRVANMAVHSPDSAFALARVGLTLAAFFEAESRDSAENQLRKALQLEPGQSHASLALAGLLCTDWLRGHCPDDRREETEVILSQVVKTSSSGVWEAELMLGVLQLAASANSSEGREHLGRALQLAPKSRQAAALAGEALRRAGLVSEADNVFQAAVDRRLWHHPLQRPRDLFWPNVKSTGFLDESSLPASLVAARDLLQSHWKEIRVEALRALEGESLQYRRFVQHDTGAGNRGVGADYGSQPAKGRWEEVYLFTREPPLLEGFGAGHCPADALPRTCELLAQLPAEMAVLRVGLSVVHAPKTRIPEHHSQAQGRLRLTCPLSVPEGAASRLHIGNASKDFVEGECFWFDESFEHSMSYDHPTTSRVSFYLDTIQPGVRESDLCAGHLITEPPPLSQAYWAEILCRADLGRWLVS